MISKVHTYVSIETTVALNLWINFIIRNWLTYTFSEGYKIINKFTKIFLIIENDYIRNLAPIKQVKLT